MPKRRKPRRERVRGSATERRITFTAPVRVQAADAGQPNAPRRFHMVLYTGEPLNLCGFDRPVIIDCASLDLSVQSIPALYDHMDFADTIVGQIQRVTSPGNGLPPIEADGQFTVTDDPHDAARFVLAKADAGFVWGASIGADPTTLDKIEPGQAVSLNGREYPPVPTGYYVSRGTVPREGSFVVLGADRYAKSVLARSRIQGAAMDFDTWLLSMGFDDKAALTPVQLANLQSMYDDEQEESDVPADPDAEGADPADPNTPPTNAAGDPPPNPDDTPPTNARGRQPAVQAGRRQPANPPTDPVADENTRISVNRMRVQAISTLCEQNRNPSITVGEGRAARQVDLCAHAVANNWTAQQVELQILRAGRGTGPNVITGQDRSATVDALSCAMILRAGGRLDSPRYQTPQAVAMKIPAFLRMGINAEQRQRAMEAGHRFASLSAIDIAREAIRLDGREIPHDRSDMLRAAFSGGSLTNIFTTNVNAILLVTYLDAPDTTAGWVREQDVADFKTNERPRMLKGPNLSKLARGHEADHASRSDTAETYKISRYAKQMAVDEQDMIDDSLGALSDNPIEMGFAAARVRQDLVYAVLLANANLAADSLPLCSTDSTRGNKLTTAALSATKLKAAAAAMRLFRENSVNLNLMPSHLIVPPTLEFTAYELVNSTENIIAGTAGSVTERGNINTLQRLGLTVVSDARLENGVTDPDSGTTYSGSSSTWWLAAQLAQTIEVGYLRGTGRAPRTRSWTYDKEGKYGIGWDVNIDVGAKALDWRGFVRNEQ